MLYETCVKLLGLNPRPGVLQVTSAVMVLVVAVVGASLACFSVRDGGGGAVSPGRGGQMAAVSSQWVTVGAGDTLWGIARAHGGHEDVREDVRKIVSLNGLDSEIVYPGQRLQMP